MTPRKKNEPEEVPNFDDAKKALEGSGYPFEIRVFETLRDAKMDPSFGVRSRLDPATPETKEIDIVAGRSVKYIKGNLIVSCDLMALIQAKRLHAGYVVGFTDSQAPTPTRR